MRKGAMIWGVFAGLLMLLLQGGAFGATVVAPEVRKLAVLLKLGGGVLPNTADELGKL